MRAQCGARGDCANINCYNTKYLFLYRLAVAVFNGLACGYVRCRRLFVGRQSPLEDAMSLLHNTFFSKQSLLYPMSLRQSAFLARAWISVVALVLLCSTPLSALAQTVHGQGMLFDIHWSLPL